MGIPTSIPSGDRRDDFSEPLPDLDLPAPLPEPAVDPRMAEFKEFQRWKKEQGAGAPQQQPTTRTRTPRTSPAPQRSRASNGIVEDTALPLDQHSEEPLSDGERWSTDPKTGKRYKSLATTPKEALAAYKKTNGKGLSLSEIRSLVGIEEDFDIDDLNGTAETFMAHLRVPPSAAEREEILRKKAELAKQQRAERAELNQELDEKEGRIEEPESDPFSETTTKKRSIFSRKS